MEHTNEVDNEFQKITIDEEFIGDVEAFERAYLKIKKEEITRLSYWNSDKETGNKMIELIPFYDEIKTVDYILPYEIDREIKGRLLGKFQCNKDKYDMLITSCGTISIYSTLNFLKSKGFKSIAIFAPVYFTVPYCCDNLNINYNIYYMDRDENGYRLSDEMIVAANVADVIWITNPVYCTSVYYTGDFINQVNNFIEQGKFVVFDESLALNGMELIGKYGENDNVISICSPHKSLCINGNKFSAIITNKKNIDFFNAWADIITGGLSISNYKAIKHFISDDFKIVNDFFVRKVQNGYNRVKKICDDNDIIYDRNVLGCFMSVYFEGIPYDYLDSKDTMQAAFFENGVSCITGSRNFFNPNSGLSFRINLTNVDERKEEIIKRFLIYLKEKENDKHN